MLKCILISVQFQLFCFVCPDEFSIRFNNARFTRIKTKTAIFFYVWEKPVSIWDISSVLHQIENGCVFSHRALHSLEKQQLTIIWAR